MDELTLNLKDAGCDAERIKEICCLYERGDTRTIIKKLRRYRCSLMDALHESQEKVDCLDFLLRKIENNKFRKDGN